MHDDQPSRSARTTLAEALIKPGTVAPADFAYEAVRITDPLLLNRLAGFFDFYWSGPPSNRGIGALPEFVIEFVALTGATTTIMLTPGSRACMTDRGSWPMPDGFVLFFRELISSGSTMQ